MAVTLGSEGLLNANLIIVQNASFEVTFTHLGPDDEPIDHTGWDKRARIKKKNVNVVLDRYVTFGDGGDIVLSIPASVTGGLALGSYRWDLMIEDSGDIYRIAYGDAKVVDSYAYDEV